MLGSILGSTLGSTLGVRQSRALKIQVSPES
jgi:hypothetical protein